MNEHDEMTMLFRLSHDKYQDKCVKKCELNKLIQDNGLFTSIDHSSKSGQTLLGMMISKYGNRTVGRDGPIDVVEIDALCRRQQRHPL